MTRSDMPRPGAQINAERLSPDFAGTRDTDGKFDTEKPSQLTVRIDLPWTTPPLSLNDRIHWAAKARTTREIRNTTHLLARSAKLPKGAKYAVVQLHYAPRDNRRRDTDNLVATGKPIFDALVIYGLVSDDTAEFMGKPEPIIHPKSDTGQGQMWLEIEVTQ